MVDRPRPEFRVHRSADRRSASHSPLRLKAVHYKGTPKTTFEVAATAPGNHLGAVRCAATVSRGDRRVNKTTLGVRLVSPLPRVAMRNDAVYHTPEKRRSLLSLHKRHYKYKDHFNPNYRYVRNSGETRLPFELLRVDPT